MDLKNFIINTLCESFLLIHRVLFIVECQIIECIMKLLDGKILQRSLSARCEGVYSIDSLDPERVEALRIKDIPCINKFTFPFGCVLLRLHSDVHRA